MCTRVARLWSWSRPAAFYAGYKLCHWYWRLWPHGTELRAFVMTRDRSSANVKKILATDEARRMAKRIEAAGGGLPALVPLADGGEWTQRYPLLTGYLVDSNYDDGSVRRPGRMFVTAERGSWTVTLKDPDAGIELTVSVDKPEEMLAALEAALSTPQPPWRVDPWAKPRAKPKAKK